MVMPNTVCDTCGLPDELCICEDVAKDTIEVEITTEERSFNKVVTIIQGLDPTDVDMSSLCSELKSRFACGGTVNDNDNIELQGDHANSLGDELEDRGYTLV